MIKIQTNVWRYKRRKEFGGIQRLEKRYYMFGIQVWRKVLDEENYPSWADISMCTLGFTDWESKFKKGNHGH